MIQQSPMRKKKKNKEKYETKKTCLLGNHFSICLRLRDVSDAHNQGNILVGDEEGLFVDVTHISQ
jgi:hypothetical protein